MFSNDRQSKSKCLPVTHTQKKTVNGVDRLVKHGIASADNRQTHIEPKHTLPSPTACQSERNGPEITLFLTLLLVRSLFLFFADIVRVVSISNPSACMNE